MLRFGWARCVDATLPRGQQHDIAVNGRNVDVENIRTVLELEEIRALRIRVDASARFEQFPQLGHSLRRVISRVFNFEIPCKFHHHHSPQCPFSSHQLLRAAPARSSRQLRLFSIKPLDAAGAEKNRKNGQLLQQRYNGPAARR